MAKAIPAVGEAFLGDDPYAMRMMKVIAGHDTAVADVVLSATNTSGYELVNLNAGVLIYDVLWQLASSFSATVDITLGLDTDLDAFAKVTDIDATVAAYNLRSMLRQYLPYDSDHVATDAVALYAGFLAEGSSQSICLDLPVAAVDAAGELEVFVKYAYMPETT